MDRLIVEAPEPITLIGGGEIATGALEEALALAPGLVAADGGAAAALAAGYRPQAVIGDFDSLSEDVRAQLPPDSLHPVAEQDSTDFDKALRSIAAPAVLAVGFLGARVDHQLAAFSTLVQGHGCADRGDQTPDAVRQRYRLAARKRGGGGAGRRPGGSGRRPCLAGAADPVAVLLA